MFMPTSVYTYQEYINPSGDLCPLRLNNYLLRKEKLCLQESIWVILYGFWKCKVIFVKNAPRNVHYKNDI